MDGKFGGFCSFVGTRPFVRDDFAVRFLFLFRLLGLMLGRGGCFLSRAISSLSCPMVMF